MPNTCPNIKLNDWKVLQQEIGYASAMRAYELNGEEIPTIEEAKLLLANRTIQEIKTPRDAGSPLVSAQISDRPISVTTGKFLQTILSKAFPGVRVQFLSQSDFNNRFGTNQRAVVGTDGIVYYNSNRISASTQVHEFGHVWVSWAKRYNAKIYQQGIRLAMEDSVRMEQIGRLYPQLSGAALADEVLSTIIGEKGAEQIEQNIFDNTQDSNALVNFFKSLWNAVTNFINKKYQKPLFVDDIQTTTLSQFAQNIASQLLSNEEISPITSDEIADIESDLGVARAQLYHNTYGDKYHENNYGAAEEKIYKPKWLDMEARAIGDLFTSFSHQLNNSVGSLSYGDFIKHRHGIPYLRNYFSVVFNAIEESVNRKRRGDSENPANKSFTLSLIQTRNEMNEGKMDDELQEVATQILSGTFNRKNLSPKAQKMWVSLVDHMVQQQHIAANGDDILLDNGQKINKATQEAAAQAEVTPWRARLNAIKDKNAYLKRTLDWIEDSYVLNVASGPLWTQMMSGKKEGMIWQLGRAIGKAVGVQAVVENNANHHLVKLYEAEWMRNGSRSLNPITKLADLEGDVINGIKVTTEEMFGMFMVLQQKNVRGSLLGNEKNPRKAKFYLPEFKGERAGQEIELGYSDYEKLYDKFDVYWDEVSSSWGNASDYIYEEVNKSFMLENGVRLSKAVNKEPNERWNIYFPLVHGKGEDAIKTFMKENGFVNDIASHKYRTPSDSETYFAGSAMKVIENYVRDNAQYAAFAIPVRNMNVFLSNNTAFLLNQDMKNYIEWWNKTERHMFSGDEDQLGEVGKHIINGFVISRLGLNPFVDLKQFTSIPLATTTIPAKYILQSQKTLFGTLTEQVKNYDVFTEWMGRDPQTIATLEEMKNHSNYALARIVGGTNEVQKFLRNGFLKALRVQLPGGNEIKIESADFMKNIKTMDTAVGAMIWNASKLYVENELGIAPGSPEYWKSVDDMYTEAVTEAQSSIDEWNRPFFAKSGSILNKALSLFAGQSFASFNGYLSRVIDYINNPNPRTMNKMAISFMNVFVINAIMVAMVDSFRYGLLSGGDDEDKNQEVFRSALFRGFYQGLPILSPIIDTVYSKYQSDMFGRELSYPVFEIINNGATAIAHAMKGKDDKAIEEMTYFGAGMLGVPTTPMRAVGIL